MGLHSGVAWKGEEIDWERQTRRGDPITGEGTPTEQGRAEFGVPPRHANGHVLSGAGVQRR